MINNDTLHGNIRNLIKYLIINNKKAQYKMLQKFLLFTNRETCEFTALIKEHEHLY